jgi:SH3-like domain-containing protein
MFAPASRTLIGVLLAGWFVLPQARAQGGAEDTGPRATDRPAATAEERRAVTRARANLRMGPGYTHRLAAVLGPGERVEILDVSGVWTRVRRLAADARVREGWVATELLQIPQASKPAPKPAFEDFPDKPLLVQILVPQIEIRDEPLLAAPVTGRVEVGVDLEATTRFGDWYRVRRPTGGSGWILNALTATGPALAVTPWPAGRRLAYEEHDPQRALAGKPPPASPDMPPSDDTERKADAEPGVARGRPQGAPLEPRLPLIDPQLVPPPIAAYQRPNDVPVRDRWRILQSAKILPYDPLDPYNPNVLKGDLPVLQDKLGPDWFFNLGIISDTLFESRRVPTPVSAQTSIAPGQNFVLGQGRQGVFAQTVAVNLALINGNTVFRPPDYEFRFVPVFNFNRAVVKEARALYLNPALGIERDDQFLAVQELFVDKHLRDVSTRYDFDSLRVGIQPFNADFRGFLYNDQPFGVRVFGTRDNNLWQYNIGWFRRLEKDTNSGLNDVGRRLRADDIFAFNLYRQDWPVLGFTTQGTIVHNRNREGRRGQFYNANGFLERPAIFGTGRARNYEVTYLGVNGDGHFGRWNLSASGYVAVGDNSRSSFTSQEERIEAQFAAAELSRDFSWIRVRGHGLYASGDRNPFDGKATGFDAILENPLIAGADTSYWIRQSVPLIGGGGTALSLRNGILASLRTSREHGQSNFINPGLRLVGVGADFDVTPQVRVLGNVSRLWFDNLSSLATLRNQRFSNTEIGTDVSVGVQYRPLFIQNIVVNASLAALVPGEGLKQLYGNATDARQYSALVNVILTY